MLKDEIQKQIIENNLSYFKEIKLTGLEEKQCLKAAIDQNKLSIIEFFMNKGLVPSIESNFSIDNLVKLKAGFETLLYLESRGIILNKVSNRKLILTAALFENLTILQHLLKNIKINHHVTELALLNIGLKYTKDEELFNKNKILIQPIINLLLKNLDSEAIYRIIEKVKSEDIKKFIHTQYLNSSLEAKNISKSKNKI